MQFSSYCLLLQTSSKKRPDCEQDALLSRLNVYIQRRYLTHFFQLIKIKKIKKVTTRFLRYTVERSLKLCMIKVSWEICTAMLVLVFKGEISDESNILLCFCECK